MPAPLLQNVARALKPAELSAPATILSTRAAEAATASTSTGSLLRDQWTNPSDVLSVLMIIGGDIVQKALAETSGGLCTPVCFSFGWVAYSFTALVNVLGDGRLLPEPDYPVKVFNLDSGYVRENKHWVIGRIGRDNETFMTKEHPLEGNALRISVFEAGKCTTDTSVSGSGRVRVWSIITMALQFGIAAIPIGVWGEWGVMMITGAGTLGALAAGALPQWRAEKLPSRRNSKKNFAISSGNGSRDIMIILGRGNCLDLEELAVQESPRSTRIWEKIDFLSNQVYDEDGKEMLHGGGLRVRIARMLWGIPLGFLMTGALCTIQSVFWIALLITVAGLKSHSWFILAVGALGMFQNAAVAAVSRDSSKRNLPLIVIDQIITRKVMDGLMDLEIAFPGQARPLLDEFFPGGIEKLREDEKEWWDGRCERYDEKRLKEHERRGIPRSRMPTYHNSNNVRHSDDNRSEDHESDDPLLEPDTSTSRKGATRSQPENIVVPKVATPQPLLAAPSETVIPIPRTPRPPEASNPPQKSYTSSPPHTDRPVPLENISPTTTTSTSAIKDVTVSAPPFPPEQAPSNTISEPPASKGTSILPTTMSESPTKQFHTKPPSPKKARGSVHFARDTDTDTTETKDFAPKQPARAMTQPEKGSPKTEPRPAASLSVDEIYNIVQSPDWS